MTGEKAAPGRGSCRRGACEESAAPRSSAASWFPGHMKKAQRILEADARLVDLVLLVLDARLPAGTRNPHLESLFRRKNRPVIFVLNKSDLADGAVTARWLEALRAEGCGAAALSTRTGKGMKSLRRLLDDAARRVGAERSRRGNRETTLRLLVAGIPNVGKSSLINALVHGVSARTGRKPGLTRGRQWLGMGGNLEVLDTPGIMMPRIESDEALQRLALVGAVRDEVLPLEDCARRLLLDLLARGVVRGQDGDGDPLEAFGRSKGFISAGAQADLLRTAQYLLKTFREGKFGPLSLEAP